MTVGREKRSQHILFESPKLRVEQLCLQCVYTIYLKIFWPMTDHSVSDLYKWFVSNLTAQQFLFGSTVSAATTVTTVPQDKHQTKHILTQTDVIIYTQTFIEWQRDKKREAAQLFIKIFFFLKKTKSGTERLGFLWAATWWENITLASWRKWVYLTTTRWTWRQRVENVHIITSIKLTKRNKVCCSLLPKKL